MAQPARPRASKTPKSNAAPKAAPAVATPAAPLSIEDEATFALRSLQQAHANNKRFDATDAELLHFYEQMVLIRRFEEKAGQLYGLGLIGGFCHLYIGQEAVAVGLQSALNEGHDSVITGYRDHGHMLAYGIDPKVIMAELTGRGAGISRGKGGSMHMFSTEKQILTAATASSARRCSLGAGLAFAHKYRGDGGVCVAYFGDGAANQGQVYETFNMASAVEASDHLRGGGQPATPWARRSSRRSSAETRFHRRGTAFRIPGMDVNGMDVLEVRAGG